jgi:hypothetical protein
MAAMTIACGGSPVAGADISCTVEGANNFAKDLDEAAICNEFRDALYANLAGNNNHAKSGVRAAIAVSPQREISVNISEIKSGVETIHPVVAVAVFDRAMNKNDIRLLAKEAAALLQP